MSQDKQNLGQKVAVSVFPLLITGFGYFFTQVQELEQRTLILEQRLIDVTSKRIYDLEKDVAIIKRCENDREY